jgi:hypothetical protein
MADEEQPRTMQLIDVEEKNIDQLRAGDRWLRNREAYWAKRGLNESEYYQDILQDIERVTGPLMGWQKFYIIAAVSGRGVEWAQTRGRAHYHIVGLPCSICRRS